MSLLRRPRAAVLGFAVAAALLAFTAFSVYRGAAPGLLPESSWGAWRQEEVANWSAHIRVNRWSHAAEAEIHWGKAEQISLRAYGDADHGTSGMMNTTFTLTPDGRLTGSRR
ncbi:MULTISPECIES: hypothetical protein [unclassified Streptomyces]|uniref:hypothetical protein n=1 Tax=unclassified Streptomyces TaxID=2593676 RepID=UPI002255A66D|nr:MULTISPECIES: hypothetical protein [unclassified Streptomyces]MCX4625686.1 hypothetical protein [Streptomyces sp. NBC_01443]WSW41735.1 hypothetical protein OG296_00470 [Streptomyces sp. NBC_01001]